MRLFCRFTLIILLFFVAFTLPSATIAQADRTAEKRRIKQNIQTFSINIQKLREGISLQQSQIRTTTTQERDLLTELEQIDFTLQQQETKLQELEHEMAGQQQLTNLKEQDLQHATEAKLTVQKHLQARIRSYYKMGKISIANLMFSSESMPQMLRFRDAFASLIKYDASIIDQYKSSISTILQARNKLQQEQAILDDFIQEASEKQEEIKNTKKDKERLLAQIKTQKELYENAVKEMEKAAGDLATSLDKLKEKDNRFDHGFLLNKGKHPSPVQGTILALFGEQRQNRLGIKGKSSGITISVPGIKRVTALFDGKISYAEYLRGYGNTIIISHGFNYFSIVSRLEKLLKKKGDKVHQGDTIGLTGDTATLMDDGIYLEIRHGSTPLDPMEWIDSKGLITK